MQVIMEAKLDAYGHTAIVRSCNFFPLHSHDILGLVNILNSKTNLLVPLL